MRMFDFEKVQRLNGLELTILNYVLAHRELVEKMTIRKLATEAHVSTSTILRFCEKLDFEGFSEFKYALKRERQANEQVVTSDYDVLIPVTDFLKKTNNDSFRQLLSQATEMIVNANAVFFFGIGTSGALAQYGSRYLANAGVFSLSIADPFMPFGMHEVVIHEALLIVLSVSGETTETISQVQQFKMGKGRVLAITNQANSTLASLADLVIPYYMPEEKNGSLNNTTQIPVVFILELLAHRVAALTKAQITGR